MEEHQCLQYSLHWELLCLLSHTRGWWENDEVYSIKEIAEIALSTLNKENLELVFSGNEVEDGNYRKDVSSDKLKRLFGDFNFTPLSEGIKKVYNIYRGQNGK